MFVFDCLSVWLHESAFRRTHMLLPNARNKIADWLWCFLQCYYFHVLTIWSITASMLYFSVCGYDDACYNGKHRCSGFCFCDLVMADRGPICAGMLVIIVVCSIQTGVEVIKKSPLSKHPMGNPQFYSVTWC